jgi:polar amino acid transport system substrate-binding protein
MPNAPTVSRCLLVVCALLGLAPIPRSAAETTLDRITRTGELVAATRDDAPPFAFRDAEGRLSGLSVDLIEAVRAALSRTIGRDIRVSFVMVSSSTRLAVIETGKADLNCETATVTWAREQRVDFTLPIFRDGTRILTHRDRLSRIQDLAEMRVGIVEGSVTGQILKERLPDIALKPYPSMPLAMQAMEAGEVDGIANVGIVLRGLLSSAASRQGMVIVPRGDALGYETIACMVPQNDSVWRDFVNGVLRDLLRGVDSYRGGYATIYDRWFGRGAAISYPLDERTVQFFRAMNVWQD